MTGPGVLRSLCTALALSVVARSTAAQELPPDSPQARRTVDLVRKAAALIDERGRAAAFADFRKPGSEWFSGATCLLSYDLDGIVLLKPAFLMR